MNKKKRVYGWAALLIFTMVCSLFGGCDKKAPEKYVATMPTEREQFDIFVEPVAGVDENFIRGVDISTILSQEKSGVKYYNLNGEEEDIFKILADAGVNYIRVRVWNDPYDKNGNGYGGGNCDAACAAEIGKRAAQYNMKLLVDFHYSDFWADPGKQMVPKAWEGMTPEEKADACYTFTTDAMNTILEAGADVGIVQLGNETTKGMSGETKWAEISKIMNKGRQAVLEQGEKYGKEIKIAVHFTNPEDTTAIYNFFRKLQNYNVEYDIFALSYYPYWHGTLKNLTEIMNTAIEKYGKQVMIAETSYAYTVEDGDGNGNSVSEKDLCKQYAATVQSQANAVRDICEAVASVGPDGLGVFYWEPAWVPVNVYDYNSPDAASVLEANRKAWEEFGSGWASSYATEYDPNDAGKYYGGSAWDNQAMFDFYGKALPSLYVFKYLQYGTNCDLKIDFVNNITVECDPGSTFTLPETVDVIYNDRSKSGPAKVSWNADDVAKVNTNALGNYDVLGTFEDGTTVNCTVKVAAVNWVKNASFESEDTSMWQLIYDGTCPADFQKKETDAYSGEYSLHYWRESEVEFKAEQTITGLVDGTYLFSAFAQGGDNGPSPEMYIYAISGDETYKASFTPDGWKVWKNPSINSINVVDGTITIGVYVKGGAGAWGTLDDFYLGKID